MACAYLHNRCVIAGDRTAPDDAELVGGRAVPEEVRGDEGHEVASSTGTATRNTIINNYF